MLSLDRQTCLFCAQSTGVFHPEEITVLEEVLSKCYYFDQLGDCPLPDDGYYLYEEKLGDELAGL